MILSLGFVWVLDGLEVTIKGAVGASLRESIGFSTVQVAGRRQSASSDVDVP